MVIALKELQSAGKIRHVQLENNIEESVIK